MKVEDNDATRLFEAWVESHEATGTSVSPEELCRDRPELLEPLRSLIENYGFVDVALRSPSGDGLADSTPDTLIGRTLSHFKITAKIGEGGMGEVYRARDTKLGREVALKVLPEAVSADADRLARFDREARVVASLNHSSIAAIHSVEHEDSLHFLVMELASGEDLGQRIARGPIPLDEALPISLQIAEALEFAHEKGIVHRDLKPANVMLASDGAVKVLDFGLAKALRDPDSLLGADLSDSPTLTAQMTQQGVILGTAGYMSPEQARGDVVDKRTDIWAFGVVLYEMLAGKRLFEGRSVTDILAAVMRAEIDLDALPAGVPRSVRRLLVRCLERDRKNRLRDIGEARFRIAEVLSGDDAATETALGSHDAVPAPARFRRLLPWIVATLGIGASVLILRDSGQLPPLRQSAIEPPAGTRLTPRSGFALSPDGSRLAFTAAGSDGVLKLWLNSFSSSSSRSLEGTDGASAPFWSPDGRHLAFFDLKNELLKRIPASGGATQILAGDASEPKGGDWSPDGRIVYTPDYRTGVFEVSAEGGESMALTTLDTDNGELSHRYPRFLPDGRTVLFLVQTAEAGTEGDQSRVEVLDAKSVRHKILSVNASAEYADPGYLLSWREGSIYAHEIDPKRWQLAEEPRLLVDGGVGLTINEWSTFSISKEGTLVYHLAASLPWRLEWHDRTGKFLSAATAEGDFADLALSPDGRRVAYIEDFTSLWVLDLERGTYTPLSFEEVDHWTPTWDPDGLWLAYTKSKPSEAGSVIARRRASGLDEEELLYSSAYSVKDITWSADGRWLAFEESGDLLLLDLERRETRTRIATPGFDFYPKFSPDGRWLAYASNESGRDEVYVVPVFDDAGKWQVSSRGGLEPEWGPSGDEIFFRGLDFELRVADIDFSGAAPNFGLPKPLFSLSGTPQWAAYEVGPDGGLLVRTQPSAGKHENFRLVQNWPALLSKGKD